jgi:hypothetical protein
MTATMSAPAALKEPAWTRRSRRFCIDAHTEFVATLVSQLQDSLSRLQTATDARPGLQRETKDIARLVNLLAAVDGPSDGRRLSPMSLGATIAGAASDLGISLTWDGEAGDELFLADEAAVRTALELLLLALAGDRTGLPVHVRLLDDCSVVLDGTMDLADRLRCGQLRSGRRVIEGEGFRLSLSSGGPRYQIRLRVGR